MQEVQLKKSSDFMRFSTLPFITIYRYYPVAQVFTESFSIRLVYCFRFKNIRQSDARTQWAPSFIPVPYFILPILATLRSSYPHKRMAAHPRSWPYSLPHFVQYVHHIPLHIIYFLNTRNKNCSINYLNAF